MSDVRELQNIEELDDLRCVWRSLLNQTQGASFFQSLEWLEVYWKHFGRQEQQKLRVLVVSSSGEPVGIVPLVVRHERTKIGLIRRLTYPLADWGAFYGPVGPNPENILAVGMQHVRQSPRDWDTIDLRWIGAPRTDPRHTAQAMQGVGFQAYRTVWNRAAVIDLVGTWEDYLGRKTSKWRNKFRGWERKLAARGEVTYSRHRSQPADEGDGDARWDLYDTCEAIANRSWQGSSTTGTTLTHESIRQYLRETHAAAAAVGGIDLNLLCVGDQPVAFAYNYYHAGYIHGLRGGYNSDLARDGAGNLLQAYSLRDSFERGDYVYDLGVGSLESKQRFLTRILPIYRYCHFHPTAPKAQLLRMKRWVEQRLHSQETPMPLPVVESQADNMGSPAAVF